MSCIVFPISKKSTCTNLQENKALEIMLVSIKAYVTQPLNYEGIVVFEHFILNGGGTSSPSPTSGSKILESLTQPIHL